MRKTILFLLISAALTVAPALAGVQVAAGGYAAQSGTSSGTAAHGASGNGQQTMPTTGTTTLLWDAATGEYVVRRNGQTTGEREYTLTDAGPPPSYSYVETDLQGNPVATGTYTGIS